jgi:phage terminase small subunit
MKTWWAVVVSEHELTAPHQLHLLEAACGAWDLMETAREALAEHGLTFEGEHGPRARPEVAIARETPELLS